MIALPLLEFFTNHRKALHVALLDIRLDLKTL